MPFNASVSQGPSKSRQNTHRAAVTRAARSAVAGARRAAAVPLHGVDGAVARAVGAVARASGAAAVCLHGDGGWCVKAVWCFERKAARGGYRNELQAEPSYRTPARLVRSRSEWGVSDLCGGVDQLPR